MKEYSQDLVSTGLVEKADKDDEVSPPAAVWLIEPNASAFGLAALVEDGEAVGSSQPSTELAVVFTHNLVDGSLQYIGVRLPLPEDHSISVKGGEAQAKILLPAAGDENGVERTVHVLAGFASADADLLEGKVVFNGLGEPLELEGLFTVQVEQIAIAVSGDSLGPTDATLTVQVTPNDEVTSAILPEPLRWTFSTSATPASLALGRPSFDQVIVAPLDGGFTSTFTIARGEAASLRSPMDFHLPFLDPGRGSENGVSLAGELKVDLSPGESPEDEWTVSAALTGSMSGSIVIDMGSPLARLEITAGADAAAVEFSLSTAEGLWLELPENLDASLSFDLFDVIGEGAAVVNNIWSETEDMLLKFPLAGDGGLALLGSDGVPLAPEARRIEWKANTIEGRYLKIAKPLLEALFNGLAAQAQASDWLTKTRRMQAISGEVLGQILPAHISFEKCIAEELGEEEPVSLSLDGNTWSLGVCMKVVVAAVVTVPAEGEGEPPPPVPKSLLEGNGRFKFLIDAENGAATLGPQAFRCEGETTLIVTDGYHSKFGDLVSLHVPKGSEFKFDTSPEDPYLEWRPEEEQSKIALRIPASGTDNLAEPEDLRFSFELESFKIHSGGIDLRGGVRTEAVSLGEESVSGFQAPVAVKGVDRSQDKGGGDEKKDEHKIGEIEFQNSRLVYGSLQAVGKLPYFDDAVGTLSLYMSQNPATAELACAGTLDISGINEFHVDALYTTFQIDVLHFETAYHAGKWQSSGAMSGRVKFIPPKGRSAGDMGELSALFEGLTVEFEDLNPLKVTGEKFKFVLPTPPKRFAFANILRVDLRGLGISGDMSMQLLGDITLQKLPGIDSSLTFGGIKLLAKDIALGQPPKFTVSRIGAQFEVASGFSMEGELEYIETEVESGFVGAFTVKTEALPAISGLLKLTRLRALDGSIVPSLALFVEADLQVALLAGFYLRRLGVGLGLRQALRGLEPDPSRTLPQKLAAFVDNPAGLPEPRQPAAWVPVQPRTASSRMDWMLVGAGLITLGNQDDDTAHPLAGGLLLAIDQDLQIVLATNIWLFASPNDTRQPEFLQRPAGRGAMGISVKEERLFAYFRTLKQPKLRDDAPKLLSEVLSQVETSLMFLADRNGFLLEVGWPWETRIQYDLNKYVKGELMAGFRFGVYAGALTFGLNYGIMLRLEFEHRLGFGAMGIRAEARLAVSGEGYFRASFIGAVDSRLRPYLLGDVRINAQVHVRAEASWSIRIKINRWLKISKRFSFSQSLNIALSAALTAALDPRPDIGFQGDARVAISVCGYRLGGTVSFGYNTGLIGDVRGQLDELMPPNLRDMAAKAPVGLIDGKVAPSREQDGWQYRFRRRKRQDGVIVVRVLLFPAPGFSYPRPGPKPVGEEPARFRLPLTPVGAKAFEGFVGSAYKSQEDAPEGFDYSLVTEPGAEDGAAPTVLVWSENLDKVVMQVDDELLAEIKNTRELLENRQEELAGTKNADEAAELAWIEAELAELPTAQEEAELKKWGQSVRDLLRAIPRDKDEADETAFPNEELVDGRTKNPVPADADDDTADIARGDVPSPNLRADTEFDQQVTASSLPDKPQPVESEALPHEEIPLATTVTVAAALTAGVAVPEVVAVINGQVEQDYHLPEGELPTAKPSEPNILVISNDKGDKYELKRTENADLFEYKVTRLEPSSTGIPPGLLLSELLRLLKDDGVGPDDDVQSPEDDGAGYRVAPAMALVLEFTADKDSEAIIKAMGEDPDDPVGNLIDLEKIETDSTYTLGGKAQALQSVLGKDVKRLPEYDLIPGPTFQSRQQVALTWEFRREDAVEDASGAYRVADDPFAAYVELEEYVVTRSNLNRPNERPRVSTVLPAWLVPKTPGATLVRPQFQFVDEAVQDLGENDLIQYKVEARAPDRTLATAIVNVVRHTVSRLAPVSQAMVLNRVKARGGKIVDGDLEFLIPYDEEGDEQACFDLNELQLRYRLVPAATVGSYGFDQRPSVKTAWSEALPARQEDEGFPNIKFAESAASRPLPWVETEDLGARFRNHRTELEDDNGQLLPWFIDAAEKATATLIEKMPRGDWEYATRFDPKTGRQRQVKVGYRVTLPWKMLVDEELWREQELKAFEMQGMALEFHIGRERHKPGKPLERSALVLCRHAVAPLEAGEKPVVRADGTLDLGRGNTVDALEWIPEQPRKKEFHTADLVHLAVDYDGPDAQGNEQRPVVTARWPHDLSQRGEGEADKAGFNPVVGYRIHRIDHYDPDQYPLPESRMHQETLVTLRVVPDRLYRALPQSIEVRGVASEAKMGEDESEYLEQEALRTPRNLDEQATVRLGQMRDDQSLPTGVPAGDWKPVMSAKSAAESPDVPAGASTGSGLSIIPLQAPDLEWDGSPIWLHKDLVAFVTDVLAKLRTEHGDGSRCRLVLHYPLEDIARNDERSDPKNILASFGRLMDDLSRRQDPYGWWTAEALGLSCECHFLDGESLPIPAEVVREAIESLASSLPPVSAAFFRAADGRTLLNVVRLVHAHGHKAYENLNVPLGLRLAGRMNSVNQSGEGLPSGDAWNCLLKRLTEEKAVAEGADRPRVSQIVRPVKVENEDGTQTEKYLPLLQEYVHEVRSRESDDQGPVAAPQAAVDLPISRQGLVEYPMPEQDRWAHRYAIAVETIRRYDSLWAMLQEGVHLSSTALNPGHLGQLYGGKVPAEIINDVAGSNLALSNDISIQPVELTPFEFELDLPGDLSPGQVDADSALSSALREQGYELSAAAVLGEREKDGYHIVDDKSQERIYRLVPGPEEARFTFHDLIRFNVEDRGQGRSFYIRPEVGTGDDGSLALYGPERLTTDPGAGVNLVHVQRTKELVAHNLIATPLAGSVQALVFRHPAAFAAAASAVNAAYGQYSGQTVILDRRVDPKKRKLLAEIYQVFGNALAEGLDWDRYQAWVKKVDGAGEGVPLLPTDGDPMALQKVKGTELGIYGADRYVFPDLPAYYQYRVVAYSTAGRARSQPRGSTWVTPLHDRVRQQPKAHPLPDGSARFERTARTLSLRVPIVYNRYHLPEDLRRLWFHSDVDETMPVASGDAPKEVRYGSLPDLHLGYQVYVRVNAPVDAPDRQVPVYVPLLRLVPPLDPTSVAGEALPAALGFKVENQSAGMVSTLLPIQQVQDGENQGQLQFDIQLELKDPRLEPIVAVLEIEEDSTKLMAVAVERHGVWSEVVPKMHGEG